MKETAAARELSTPNEADLTNEESISGFGDVAKLWNKVSETLKELVSGDAFHRLVGYLNVISTLFSKVPNV